MIDTVREMLDLPKAERSRYLEKLPLTRTFVMGAMEESGLRFFRRTIVRNGGTYRECYRMPGVFWVATFRDQKGMRRCVMALVRHLNKSIRESAELHGHLRPEDLTDMLYGPTFGTEHHDVPALAFGKDIWILREERILRSGFHPVTGKVLS